VIADHARNRGSAPALGLCVSAGRRDLLPPPALHVEYRWRGVDAGVYAYGYTDGQTWWLRWPRVGTFRMMPSEASVTVVPEDGVTPAVLEDAFRRGVTPVALLQRGLEVLHASGILIGGRVVALCAASGTGKSTMAAALSQQAAPHWADDFVAWTLEPGSVSCRRYPSEPRLDRDAAATLEASSSSVLPYVPRQAALGAIVILQRGRPSAGIGSLELVDPSQAFTAILAHAHECGLGGAARYRASVDRYLELAAGVPVFRLVFEPDLLRLQELAADVHQQLREALRPCANGSSTPAISS